MRQLFVVLGCLAAFGLIFQGCGSRSAYMDKGELKSAIEMENENAKFIIAMGIGAAPKDITDSTQRKAMSKNAAVVAAQYDLVSRLKGVKLEGGITIEKAVETDSKIKATVDAMIKGANITKIEWTNDDGCVVTLQLNKKEVARELGLKLEK